MPENNSDNRNNERKTESGETKKGFWSRFTSLPLKVKFYMIFSAVLLIFMIALIVMIVMANEHNASPDSVIRPNWYGFLIGMAIVLCVVWGNYAALRQGYYFDLVFDYVIFAVPFAFGGGALYYGIFNNWQFGIAVIGALIGALAGLLLGMLVYRLLFKKKPKVSLLQMIDLAVVFVLLGQAIGRVGCYLADPQCCYGIAVEKEVFPFSYRVFDKQGNDLGIHLGNPFIESIWCLIGFIPMIIMYMSKRKSFNGFYTSVYCIWYGVERLIMEGFRDPMQKLQANGDGMGSGFGVSQVMSILMIAFGVIWIAVYVIRALATKKKIMILVPKEKLCEDYLDYTHTIYYRPHVDDEGRLIDYEALEAKKAETSDCKTQNKD